MWSVKPKSQNTNNTTMTAHNNTSHDNLAFDCCANALGLMYP